MVILTNSFSFTLRPRPPYNFELTVQKPAGWDLFTPAEIYRDGVLWTSVYIGGLLTGLRLNSNGTTSSPRILVRAFSKERLTSNQKNDVKQTVIAKLGINEDLNEFYAVAKRDKILKHTVQDLYGMHDTQSSSLYGAAILAICLQMAPLKRSNQMMGCILKKYGVVAQFDGKEIQTWPLPEFIARLKTKEFAKESTW